MKRKSLVSLFILLFLILLSSCTNSNNVVNNHKKIEHNCEFSNNYNELATIAEKDDVTMEEFVRFIETKKEHYPLSDQLTERYQQKSGGYIENGPAAGIVVDKEQFSPNQKWHFLHSWFYPSIEDGDITWDASAYSRVYVNLRCPELVIWIYEACGVNPSKVREAAKISEEARVNGTNLGTMVSNMRKVVPWNDILTNVLAFLEENPESGVKTYPVTVNTNSDFNVSGLKSRYEEGNKVTFTINVTNSNKEIQEVKINGEVANPVNGATYEFIMPASNVTINVTLKTVEGGSNTPNPNPGDVEADYQIIYDMNGASRSKELKTAEAVLTTFNYVGDDTPVIASISDVSKVYGGAYGSGWVFGDVLKLGTQSVTGGFTMVLNKEVDGLIITGYTGNTKGQVRVGDSNSTDWSDEADDNKTSVFSTAEMSVAGKETGENKQTSTIMVSFASTNSVRIETANNYPFYITAIKFIVNE